MSFLTTVCMVAILMVLHGGGVILPLDLVSSVQIIFTTFFLFFPHNLNVCLIIKFTKER